MKKSIDWSKVFNNNYKKIKEKPYKFHKNMNFYDSWNYLDNHSYFKDKYDISYFQQSLDIEIVKVNPKTNSIDNNSSKNTKVRVWLECGCSFDKKNNFIATHDIKLDCGANTFEKAIIKLAKNIHKYIDLNRG